MARLIRIDSELVRRGLARSRDQAARLVTDGRVTLDGAVVLKPARQVDPARAIERLIDSGGDDYVSRGAHKLAGALDALSAWAGAAGRGPPLPDAGASTGAFHRRPSSCGAEHVVAVDVGYGQLAWSLRSDPRSRSWSAPMRAPSRPRRSPLPRGSSWATCPSSP